MSPKVPPRVTLSANGGTPASGRSVFDQDVEAVNRLDPGLLHTVRRAATDAARDNVRFSLNSGWRSAAEQERLFREAVKKYGSDGEAVRWVARPGTSPHEAGDAVDLGPAAALTWLERHGASYGLCQTYRNEPWHFELRHDAVEHGCPTPYADPADDPRLGR